MKYTNSSRYSGNFTESDPLVFEDTVPDGLEIISVTLENAEPASPSSYTVVDNKVTVNYVGEMKAYDSIDVVITCKVNTTEKTIAANTGSVSHSSGDTKIDTSNEITVSDISFNVDKFAIADNEPISTATDAESFIADIIPWETAKNSDKVIESKKGEKEYGSAYPGQRVTFYVVSP